jgi:hypothetical protein
LSAASIPNLFIESSLTKSMAHCSPTDTHEHGNPSPSIAGRRTAYEKRKELTLLQAELAERELFLPTIGSQNPRPHSQLREVRVRLSSFLHRA